MSVCFLSEGQEEVPRLLAPRLGARHTQGLWTSLYVPIAFLQQVPLLLAAILLVALELVHAVPPLPALGILEKRNHGSDRCWRQFSSPWLCSATEPLPIGLGLREWWDFESCQVLAFISEEKAGQRSSRQRYEQIWGRAGAWGPGLVPLVQNPVLLQDHSMTKPVYTGSRSKHRKGWENEVDHETSSCNLNVPVSQVHLPPFTHSARARDEKCTSKRGVKSSYKILVL